VGGRIRAAWRGPVESKRSTSRTPKASVLGRPGWRLDEDVLTSEDVPDTKTLNREGLDEVALGERAYDRTRHAEIGE
jgi:hypothetical protein